MSQSAQYLAQVYSNPLVAGIKRPWTADGWIDKLGSNPMSSQDYENAKADPKTIIGMLDNVFVPTAQLAKIAATFHELLWDSYLGRDPRYVTSQGRPKQRKEGERPMRIAIRPRGAVLQGITGMGKTTLIERILDQFPQVIDHGPSVDGKADTRQLVYLVVPMPPAASTGAFARNLARAIDQALDTNYESQIKGRTVQSDLEMLCNVLRDYHCGVLIIEETQEHNKLTGVSSGPDFGITASLNAPRRQTKALGASFTTYFTNIMNAGIVLWLIGNPLAFEQLLASTQITSRLGSNCFYLHPALAADQDDWDNDYFAGIWGATCFPNPDEELSNLRLRLFRKVGGFPHLLVVLRKFAIYRALMAGADRVRAVDITAALDLDLGKMGEIAEAFTRHQLVPLIDSTDIPHEVYLEVWKQAGLLPINDEEWAHLLAAAANALTPAPSPAPSSEPPTGTVASAGSSTPGIESSDGPAQRPVRRARRTPDQQAFDPEDLRSPSARRKFEQQNTRP